MRALVTGGAIRLGHDISLYLAGQGYDVAVHYATSADEARSTVSEIEAIVRWLPAVPLDWAMIFLYIWLDRAMMLLCITQHH